MGRAGPATRLPPVDSMVQQIATQSLSVLPLQVVAESDFDLAPDLLAATDYMSPTVTPPSAAVPPATSVDVDFGDLTLGEITSFLPPGSELPLELDTPWSTPTSMPPVEESSTTSAVADALLALANVSGAPVSSSFARCCFVPCGSVASLTPAATSTSVRSSGVASPARATEESDDDDLDEYGDPNDPYSAASLLRAAKNFPERPSLPDAPTRHPPANWKNSYNPEAPIDPDAVYPIDKNIDRIGTPPHVAYPVEWNCRPCQLSWEWPENLREVPWCINQVNAWKASGSDLSFNAFYGCNFRGAGANEKNLYFLYAFQASCYGLGCPGLVSGDHWERICRAQGNEFPKGVLAKAIDAFFNFVRSDGVRLDYVELFKKCLKVSVTSFQVLDRDVCHLPPGYYIVRAAEDLVEHCFALILHGPEYPVEVFDDYQEGKDPPCKPEPLSHLELITKVYALYRVALPKPKSKRSKKPKKKVGKKTKLSSN
ncbi:hypothetical protein PHPALM_27969 [Phytophthora palmivora]|uniref:Uncharacterized protein n=1 Tax=Phytophthora palmivora TaxID=4796 RepID=A0A2P4XBA8_9STRA|nr:hypothetical protein PHPALM_27969 [Phytophthora palmivora]